MRVLVDTSAWMAIAADTDPHHAAAKKALGGLPPSTVLFTSNYVVDESLTLMRARTGHRSAVRLGERLRDSAVTRPLVVEPDDQEAAWNLFVQYADHPLSFTDCTIVAQARRLKLDAVFTFDRAFARLGLPVVP